ncbi:TIR domain-containing protein [Kribbella sp. C-35]|uniref:nSTAND1 domain-containing NTPase n=1 Tax=Kribbella sp. C-35 TaxID=2789276 RepID=UPI003978AE47
MSGLFLSYAHVDRVPAKQLQKSLQRAGYQVFLDTDPDGGIPAGTLWADELHRNIERSDIVVFLASVASLASPWCHTELSVAVARRKHVVQVSRSEVGVHPVLAARQVLPAARSVSDIVPHLLDDLEKAGFGPSDRGAWDPNRSPYPGLFRLTAEYAPVFFGREDEIDDLMHRVFGPKPAPILVVGASGSGKSSLLRAGVLARLERRKKIIVLPPIEPGQNPLGRFAFALAARDPALDPDRISTAPRGIADAVDRLTVHGDRVVAFIDQAEDLLTVDDPQRTTDLLDQLKDVDRDRLTLLVALRSASMDAWGKDQRFSAISSSKPIWVRPLDRDGLRDVILGPAKEAGITFEPRQLVEAILDDTGDGRALPLLAALLEELAEGHSRVHPATIDKARYELVGPVERVIERRAGLAAAQARSELGMTDEQVIQAFLRLAELDDRGNVVRTEQEVASLSPTLRRLFEVFERHRLVIRDLRTPAPDEKRYVEPVEIITAVHEVVFTAWPALANAVDEQRGDLVLRSRLRREAEHWASAGGGVVSLTGARLERANEWRKRHPDDVSPELGQYLNAATHQRRRRRTLTVATPILAAVAAVVTVFAVLLFRQVGVANEARRTTDALRLVGESESAQRMRPDLSLLLALEAAARGGDPRAVNAPFVALTRGAGPRRYQQIPARLAEGAFSAAGARAVVRDTEGNSIDWDAAAGQQVLKDNASVNTVTISADGSTVAVADVEAVRIRSFGSDAWRCRIPGGASDVRLTPNGRTWAALSADQAGSPSTAVRLGTTSGGCVVTRQLRLSGTVADAAIDNGRLAVLLNDGDVAQLQIISLGGQRGVRTISVAQDASRVTSVALAQDEVATLDTLGILRVSRLTEEAPQWQTRAFSDEEAGVALAPLPQSPRADRSSSLRWLAAGANGSLAVLTTGDDRPGAELASLPALGDPADPAALALGTGIGTANVVDETGRITSWSFHTETAFDPPALADRRIDNVAALSDGGLVVTGPDGAWTLNGQNQVTQLAATASDGILVARDQTWALASPTGQIFLGPELKVLGSVRTTPVAIAFVDSLTTDPQVVVVERDGRTTVFGNGQPLTLLTGARLGSTVVAGTAGGERLYLALANGRLAVVDTTALSGTAVGDSENVRTYPAHGDGPTSAVAISPDGKLLATGGDDRRVVLWDLHDGVPQARPALIGHDEKVVALTFNPDAGELASSAEDGVVIRWNLARGEQTGQPVHLPSIPALAYTRDGGPALIVTSTGVSRWPLSPDRWRDTTCHLLGGRTFSDTERRQILGDTDPMVTCPSR